MVGVQVSKRKNIVFVKQWLGVLFSVEVFSKQLVADRTCSHGGSEFVKKGIFITKQQSKTAFL